LTFDEKNMHGINSIVRHILAHLSPVVSLSSLVYSVALTCFRHATYEDKGILDSFGDMSRYIFLGYVNYRVLNMGNTLGQFQALIHIGLMAFSYRLVSHSYTKYVAGKTYKPVNCTGRVYIITGCNTGIGYETAKAIVKMGGTVVMACRTVSKAKEARENLLKETNAASSKLIVLQLDLCDFDSVRNFAKEFKALLLPLHCLINNAGVMMDERNTTSSGMETVMTSNHFSHFLLTNLLLGHLNKTNGRIVVLSSSLHKIPKAFNFDDIWSEKNYSLFGTYSQAKLANVMFMRTLSAMLSKGGSRVTVNCVHPGCVRTDVTRHMNAFMRIGDAIFAPIMRTLQKTPEQGAYCSVYVATSADLTSRTGDYYFHCSATKMSSAALNEEDCLKLWKVSEEITQSAKDTSAEGKENVKGKEED